MCYNTRETRRVKEREEYYNVSLYPNHEGSRDAFDIPNYHNNGYSHNHQLVIIQQAPQYLVPVKWGIVPREINGVLVEPEQVDDYYKNKLAFKPDRNQGLNAKAEKLFDWYYTYNFNDAIFKKRCIIPVDGFYEFHKLPNDVSVPFNFQNKTIEPLSLAGIYTVLKGNLGTFTIITKSATPLFKEIHNTKNRQPLMLGRDEVDVWLNAETSEDEIKNLLNYNYDNNKLEAYPISRDFSRPKVNSNNEGITEKVDYIADSSDIKGFDLSTYKYKHLFD